MAAADETPAGIAGSFRPGTTRGVEGFFRVAQEFDGRWLLLDGGGRPFWCRAVHGVSTPAASVDGLLPADPAARLRTWGFNVLGCGSNPDLREDGLAFLGTVGFDTAGPVLSAPGLRLPDVFDPDWPRRAQAHAAVVCAPLADARALLGWVTDDAIAWAQPGVAGLPTLLQLCLALEPHHAAYHAAWEFVLALHGGRLAAVARAWEVPLANKEVIREFARAETGLATRGYLRDQARWTREFARRYFTTAAAAIRAADPNHLVFGCRFRQPAGAHVLAACAYPAVDVALIHQAELPSPAPVNRIATPFVASEVAWSLPGRPELAAPAARRLTSIERMLQRARTTLARIARHPLAVGYAWGQWQDEPGEQPPFARGLLHVNGREAREHTELLADFNARAQTMRRPPVNLLSS